MKFLRQTSLLPLLLALAVVAAEAQRIPKAGGFNFFSKEQDVQLGKEAAAEIEKQVHVVNNKELNEYVAGIGRRLMQAPEADQYPYTFKVVQDEAINAFALPGGPTYVNTGLIAAAENEAQLAGVMSHEISHVALRHGTKQASKANIISLGAMLGGGLLGGGGSMLGSLAQLGIGLGANSVLLKYSRNAERDADLLGARIMAQAGYNPIEAARFFETLEAETGKRSGLEQFFSSHPNPGNRSQRIEKELPYMPKGPYNGDTGKLDRMKAIVGKLPPAPKKPEAPKQQGDAGTETSQRGEAPAPLPPPTTPSERVQSYRGRQFALNFPDNWRQMDGERSVTFAPQGGIVQGASGGSIGRGVIASFLQTQSRNQVNLERDTKALIENFQSGNPSLRVSGRRPRRTTVDGQPALLTTLYSDSPYSGGGREVDLLLTVARPDGIYYMLFIAPQHEYRHHQQAFEKILHSVRFQF